MPRRRGETWPTPWAGWSNATPMPNWSALARSCLRSERNRRPRNAGEVAGRITAYLVGVQERLKAAELGQVEAQMRAEEARARAVIERSRRRRTVALAASVLITAAVIGGGWTYLAQQRTARLMATSRVVTEALAEAERLRGQAQAAGLGDLSKWSEAMGAARALTTCWPRARRTTHSAVEWLPPWPTWSRSRTQPPSGWPRSSAIASC